MEGTRYDMKKLFLLGVSMMILAGCGGETEETDGEEGMGTLSAESEEGNETETDNDSESESESTEESAEEEPSHDTGLLDLSDNEEGWLNFDEDVSVNN